MLLTNVFGICNRWCLYPSQSSALVYKTLIEFIIHIINEFPSSSFIFCGDNNIPEIYWDRGILKRTFTYSFSSVSNANMHT